MELKELYDKLLEEDYWPIKIYQLLFLYRFLEERGKEGQFFNFLSKIDSGYETEQLEQLIKCMTHDIPYELFIEDQYVSAAQINEMRRYLEDSQELYGETKEWERSYLSAKQILSKYWSPDMIYQLRRFIKCENPLKIEYLEKVYKFINENRIHHWAIINRLYETYVKKGRESLLKQMYDKEFMELIRNYHRDDESIEGDYILMQIIEYSVS